MLHQSDPAIARSLWIAPFVRFNIGERHLLKFVLLGVHLRTAVSRDHFRIARRRLRVSQQLEVGVGIDRCRRLISKLKPNINDLTSTMKGKGLRDLHVARINWRQLDHNSVLTPH
jgi:hypothetical protein